MIRARWVVLWTVVAALGASAAGVSVQGLNGAAKAAVPASSTIAAFVAACEAGRQKTLVTLRGSVTLAQGMIPDDPAVFYLQDETAGVSATTRKPLGLRLSQKVEVVAGCSIYDELEVEARIESVRDLGRGAPVQPRLITVEQAVRGEAAGSLVRVRGRVLAASVGETRDRLQIGEGEASIGAYIRRPLHHPPVLAQMAPPDSTVELHGILILTSRGLYQVRLRQNGDLHLLETPRSWLMRNLTGVLAVMSVLTALVALWILTLQRSIRNQTAQIRKLLEEARAASDLKTQFLANISHELRTPIHGILGLQSLLLDTPLPAEQRAQLRIANEATRSLRALLDDLLDLSRIEAGKLLLSPEPFSPARLVRQSAEQFAARASEKQVALRHEIDPLLPTSLSGDVTRLRQILTNLVSNAVKFTAAGEVLVYCRLVFSDGEKARVRFGVRDTGIGIEPGKLEHIFGSFHQADGSISRRFGGSGLGLAIASRLANLMESRIEVRSEVQAGSDFSFELTLPVLEETTLLLPEEPQTWPVALRVLLAEDNLVNQLVAVRLLEKDRHQVSIAVTGREAVERYRAARFDVVLMDVQMPEMDGLEATRQIRELESGLGRSAPIVALSAHTMKQEAERCLQAGMDGFLGKPFQHSELRAVLQQFAGRRGISGDCS
jgi:signal transduction histidine kinase/ActR/RegA family two-component response regulator